MELNETDKTLESLLENSFSMNENARKVFLH